MRTNTAECVSAMCMINAVMTPSKVREGEVEGEGRGNSQLINLFRLSSVLLTGQGAQQYRGLLVQGRHGATPVGSFSAKPLTQPTCPGVSST